MKLGNKVIIIFILLFSKDLLITEEKITSTPLINVEQITPTSKNYKRKMKTFL